MLESFRGASLPHVAALALAFALAAGATARAQEPQEPQEPDTPTAVPAQRVRVADALERLAVLRGASFLADESLRERVLTLPGAVFDAAPALTGALSGLGVVVVDVAEKDQLLLYAFSAEAAAERLAALTPRYLGPKDPIPEGNVYVTRLFLLKMPTGAAYDAVGAVQSAQTRDSLGVGQLHYMPATRVLLVTDLAPRVAFYEQLIAGVAAAAAEQGEEVSTTRIQGGRRITTRPAVQQKQASRPGPSAEALTLTSALRSAINARARTKVDNAEQDLVRQGTAVLGRVRESLRHEKEPRLKASLHYVMLAIEGYGAQSVIDRMRATIDGTEQQQLASVLVKFKGPEHAAVIEKALLGPKDPPAASRDEGSGEEGAEGAGAADEGAADEGAADEGAADEGAAEEGAADEGAAEEGSAEEEEPANPMVKRYLIRALGESGGDQGLETLMRVARAEDDRQIRIEVIRAIARRASPAAAAQLQRLLADPEDDDDQVRSMTVRELARIGTREQAELFAEILREDERTNNRLEAAGYFGRTGYPEDLPMLEAAAEAETVQYIRQRIQSSLAQIRQRDRQQPR